MKTLNFLSVFTNVYIYAVSDNTTHAGPYWPYRINSHLARDEMFISIVVDTTRQIVPRFISIRGVSRTWYDLAWRF